jgi:hypothetical protein
MGAGSDTGALSCESVLRKRKRKMAKHKLQKRLAGRPVMQRIVVTLLFALDVGVNACYDVRETRDNKRLRCVPERNLSVCAMMPLQLSNLIEDLNNDAVDEARKIALINKVLMCYTRHTALRSHLDRFVAAQCIEEPQSVYLPNANQFLAQWAINFAISDVRSAQRWRLVVQLLRLAQSTSSALQMSNSLLELVDLALEKAFYMESELLAVLSMALGVYAAVTPLCTVERISSLIVTFLQLLPLSTQNTADASGKPSLNIVSLALAVCCQSLRLRAPSERVRVKASVDVILPAVMALRYEMAKSHSDEAGLVHINAVLDRLVADLIYDSKLLGTALSEKRDNVVSILCAFVTERRDAAMAHVDTDADDGVRRYAALARTLPALFGAIAGTHIERDVMHALDAMQAFEQESLPNAAVRSRQAALQTHAARIDVLTRRLWRALSGDTFAAESAYAEHAIAAASALLRRVGVCGVFAPGTPLDALCEQLAVATARCVTLPMRALAAYHGALLALNVRSVLSHRRALLARLWTASTVTCARVYAIVSDARVYVCVRRAMM